MIQDYEIVYLRQSIQQIASETTDIDGILECLVGKRDKNPSPPPLLPVMVRIPASDQISIGTPESELEALFHDYQDLGVKYEWLAKQAPQHSVSLNAFSMAKYAFTNLEWLLYQLDTATTDAMAQQILADINPSKLIHPYEKINPILAEEYIAWLNTKTTSAQGMYRLPSEYEWEYAATQGEGESGGGKYPWGNDWVVGLANTAECGIGGTLPVCYGFDSNSYAFGLVQMAGNVEELTSTPFHFYPNNEQQADGFTAQDPHHRVTRGGSYTKWRDLACCQRRHAASGNSPIGMRLAFS